MGVFDYLDKEDFSQNLQIKFYLIWGRVSFYTALGAFVVFLINLILYLAIPGMVGENVAILIPSMFGVAAAVVGLVFAEMGARNAKSRKVKCAIIGTGRALSILTILLCLTLVIVGIVSAVI